jgi:hypothetical protein
MVAAAPKPDPECYRSNDSTMSLKHLKPFQVDPNRVNKQEVKELVDKISNNSKVSEIQEIFDANISLCAYFLKNGYIDYQDIYFLSTSLIVDNNDRPDYICGCYHTKTGVSWYAIICAGPQEQPWGNDLTLTTVGKKSFDRLNYCLNNLGDILISNGLIDAVDSKRLYGIMIVGQDRDFFRNPEKQALKREINQNSSIQLRTYGAFLRRFKRQNKLGWLENLIQNFLNLFQRKL